MAEMPAPQHSAQTYGFFSSNSQRPCSVRRERHQEVTKPAASMSFSFGFAGEDISEDEHRPPSPKRVPAPAPAPAASAFPVAGKPQLPPTHHDLAGLLAQLPSKIAYGTLDVTLDDGQVIKIPRRELWDVRVQLMAEEEEISGQAAAEGLGSHDVKTGVYEGGFKSWESSVDLVKVLAANNSISALLQTPVRVIEVRRTESPTPGSLTSCV